MFMILTAYYEKKLAFSRKIQQIIFYPCMVMVISLWIVCGLLLFVIPRFVELFQDSQDKLPLLTHFIFYCSFYFRSYIIIFFFMIQMIKIGEETGKLDDMLDKTADFIESDIDQMTAQLSKMIEPLIMLFLGVLIGGIVIGMYLPIFKLGTTF